MNMGSYKAFYIILKYEILFNTEEGVNTLVKFYISIMQQSHIRSQFQNHVILLHNRSMLNHCTHVFLKIPSVSTVFKLCY